MRINGAEDNPDAVGQVVNVGHGLEGMSVMAGQQYRMRMRVQVRVLISWKSLCERKRACLMSVMAGQQYRMRMRVQVSGCC